MFSGQPEAVERWLVRAGSCLLALLFLAGAAQKFGSPGDGQALLDHIGLPTWLIWPALVFNALAGLALLIGVWRFWVALALAVYCIVTSVLHINLGGDWQISIAVKNWAIAGGLLILAAVSVRPR